MRKMNDRRKAVYTVQEWLLTLKNAGMPLPSIVPDGIFDKTTEEAVRVFQGLSGIPQTGAVDERTWNELRIAALEAKKAVEGSVPIYPFDCMKAGMEITQGEHCDLMYIVQAMLRTLEGHYKGLEEQDMNGTCDEVTSGNIRCLQKLWGLRESGNIDVNTWNMLACAYNEFMNRE
ncbi:MAG: peptidoglycan-binding protein [Clostridia bacterium]|nr:peptidoglycan-binding protein [Clostridia bacterium]